MGHGAYALSIQGIHQDSRDLVVFPWCSSFSGRTRGGRWSQTCNGALQTGPAVGRWELRLGPGRASTRAVTLPGNQSVLLVAHEDQVDVDIDVSSPTHAAAQAGNPVRRNGVLHVLLRTDSSGLATISVRATADGGLGSRVTIQAYNNEAPQPNACQSVAEALAAGDAAFARARLISAGRAGPNAGSATDLYDTAYRNYVRAFVGLAPGNRALRAQVAHVVASLLCEDIGKWREGEHWSALAAQLFQLDGNAYGRASAQSLQASTWMELAQLPDAASATDPAHRHSRTLLHKALLQLRRLAAFHERRGELFDAAEQYNLAGLTLYNTGQYTGALDSYGRARRLYEGLGERYWLALVLQNSALVDWGPGQVLGCAAHLRRALDLVDAAESPALYALILDNDGLANRTAGRLDAALAQHAKALELTSQIQDNGERGRSLFGIGMVYSAVGDRRQAADFLHQGPGHARPGRRGQRRGQRVARPGDD